MSPDTKLVLLFGVLHIAGLVFGGTLLAMSFRSGTVIPWSPPEDGEDGGGGRGNDRLAPQDSGGPRGDGLPLPDAAQSRVRLREPGRLADALPARERRPSRPPERPRPRVPADD